MSAASYNRIVRWLFVCLGLACTWAQTTPEPPARPVLENAGKPIRLPFQCGEDDLRAFGLTCPDGCPVYLELAAVEPVSTRVFLIGNLHTEGATLYSVLLASDDGGKSWTEGFDRIRSAALDQIQFIDFANGWASGQLFEGLPRDPFLVLTHDGGKTWNRYPVFTESRLAVIEAFRFQSGTEGTMWIDRTSSSDSSNRYEMLDSRTGGESWTMREASDHPLLPKDLKRPANADWRLRADASSRAYRLERRESGTWHTVASFAIGVGECRDPELKLSEPPPPQEEAAPETAPPLPAQPKAPPSLKKKP